MGTEIDRQAPEVIAKELVKALIERDGNVLMFKADSDANIKIIVKAYETIFEAVKAKQGY
ncbi:hypothetical protein [Lysobacter capsici]|uniref:hypothetical protein n=1 Tax=Lysobacter capsici TaxID=435897 RepID=UPI0004517A73|nr:hypothetical protein [Lysobacter capsici]